MAVGVKRKKSLGFHGIVAGRWFNSPAHVELQFRTGEIYKYEGLTFPEWQSIANSTHPTAAARSVNITRKDGGRPATRITTWSGPGNFAFISH
jgi:hypothetical protein